MQEALQAVLSSDLVDRAGVWMEADAHVPSFEPGMSSDFRGIVADRNGEAVPPECVRLPYEAPTLRELLEKSGDIMTHCVEVNRLENLADKIAREAIAKLFEEEKDPIHLIKLKELYEVLETATDKAEDAANVLETVLLKSA